MPTPYDGKICVWHVYGGMIAETTIAAIGTTLKQYAPAVTALFVKVTDGTDWMGAFETKPDLAINGPADITRWVTTLQQYGIEFHAWALPKGVNPQAEAAMMIQVCKVPGVKSLILDVEGGTGFFRGGKAAIRQYMVTTRTGIPSDFHIGMSIDPRSTHFNDVFPAEWFPFINSIHPQVYWGEFGESPTAALQDTYNTWGNYGRPIIPALQAYNVNASDMNQARVISVNTHKATGISWYVFGGIGPSQFAAVNVELNGTVPPPSTPPVSGAWQNGAFGKQIIVTPDSPNYHDGTYDNIPNPLQTFKNLAGWTSKYIATSNTSSRVWARWDPTLPAGGYWEVSAHIPSQHATTNNARYKLHGIVGLGNNDYEVDLKQAPDDDNWASMGIYNFVSGPNSGVIFLTDFTGETGLEVDFDAIRWRQLLNIPVPPAYLADGHDSPEGTGPQRATPTIYPAPWHSVNPYGNFYYLGPGQTNPALHTGDDLEATPPTLTAHQPVYATASGVVTCASRQTGTWGNVIVIRNDPLLTTGQVTYARYGHVETMQVKVGDRVSRGQYIANTGNAFGVFAYHLHFDISPTSALYDRPWDWPGTNKTRLNADYVDPHVFLQTHRPAQR